MRQLDNTNYDAEIQRPVRAINSSANQRKVARPGKATQSSKATHSILKTAMFRYLIRLVHSHQDLKPLLAPLLRTEESVCQSPNLLSTNAEPYTASCRYYQPLKPIVDQLNNFTGINLEWHQFTNALMLNKASIPLADRLCDLVDEYLAASPLENQPPTVSSTASLTPAPSALTHNHSTIASALSSQSATWEQARLHQKIHDMRFKTAKSLFNDMRIRDYLIRFDLLF